MKCIYKEYPRRTSERSSSRVLFLCFILMLEPSCSLLATRPVQDFSDNLAALRAAKEVQADTLAPELFRQANEWFIRAKREYRFKNFQAAKDFSIKSRHFAEEAEFESMLGGGNRNEIVAPPDPYANSIEPAPPQARVPSSTAKSTDAYPVPEGTPADVYDQRKAEEDAKNAAALAPPVPTPTPASPLSPPAPGGVTPVPAAK